MLSHCIYARGHEQTITISMTSARIFFVENAIVVKRALTSLTKKPRHFSQLLNVPVASRLFSDGAHLIKTVGDAGGGSVYESRNEGVQRQQPEGRRAPTSARPCTCDADAGEEPGGT